MMVTKIRLALGLGLGILIFSSALGQNYETIDPPGSLFTQAFGLNNRGDIVGLYSKLPTLETTFAYHGFLRRRGEYELIDFPGAPCTAARRINDRGDIVGFYQIEGCPGPFGFAKYSHGFLLKSGKFYTVDVPNGSNTHILGINNKGEMVGSYSMNGTEHGFLLKDKVFYIIDPPQSVSALAQAINSDGDIVGRYTATDGSSRGFLFRDDVFTDVVITPGARTVAQGINNEGDISGVSGTNGFIRLEDAEVFALFRVPGSLSTSAQSINARRRVVGQYCTALTPADCGRPGSIHGFLRMPAQGEDEERTQESDN